MHAELMKLLDLQTRDLSLVEVEARLRSILAEIAKLEAELEAGQREIQVAEKRLADGLARRGDLEGRIEGYRAVEARRKERLELARGAREAQAVMTEVEIARAVLAREEQEWVKVAEGVTDLERGAKTSRERLTEAENKQAEERARLAAEQAALEAERDAARSERNGVAAGIDRGLRARYDRLRSARSVAVVVALRGEACGACYTSVPRNRRTQIRAGILLDNCEACGVILYSEDASS